MDDPFVRTKDDDEATGCMVLFYGFLYKMNLLAVVTRVGKRWPGN
jgi:hypothetical protein